MNIGRCVVLGVVALCAAGAMADETNRPVSLQQQLDDVRARISAAQGRIVEEAKALWTAQHQVQSSDPETAELREEISRIEKQLIAKRQELCAKMGARPEIREIEKRRKDVFEELTALREQEQLILNEIALEQRQKESGP